MPHLNLRFASSLQGPCIYGSRDIQAAHAKLQLTDAHFNTLTEGLYIAFDTGHPPQNELVALLAPMQRLIVRQ